MADTIGAVEIPLQTPTNGEAAADPALTRIANYFQAVLNQHGGANWRTLMPKSTPVKKAFTHNPEEVNFSENDLPALYLYTLGEDPFEQLSADYDITQRKLRLLWVFPVAGQDSQKGRSTYVNGIVVILKHFIELGRDPSYVFAGDTDPTAATLGSVIYRVAKIFSIKWNGYKQGLGTGFRIRTANNQRSYYHMDATILLQEKRVFDLEADFPKLEGADFTVTTPDKARDLAVGKT